MTVMSIMLTVTSRTVINISSTSLSLAVEIISSGILNNINSKGNVYALLTKRECIGEVLSSRSIKTQRKERGQYPPILTEQAWSVKDLMYGQKITPKNCAFFLREQSGKSRAGKIGPSFPRG